MICDFGPSRSENDTADEVPRRQVVQRSLRLGERAGLYGYRADTARTHQGHELTHLGEAAEERSSNAQVFQGEQRKRDLERAAEQANDHEHATHGEASHAELGGGRRAHAVERRASTAVAQALDLPVRVLVRGIDDVVRPALCRRVERVLPKIDDDHFEVRERLGHAQR